MTLVSLFFLLAATCAASTNRQPLNLVFEEDKPGKHYVARGPGYLVSLAPDSASITLETRASQRGRVRMQFEHASPHTRLSPEHLLPARTNYFVGSDPRQWRTGVPVYSSVRYGEIYRGIDLVFYGKANTFEYDFVVRPGGDPASIRMRITGARDMRIDSGDLVLATDAGELRWKEPVIYQPDGDSRGAIRGRFMLDGEGMVRFQIGHYSRNRDLVIDPALSFSSYLGGIGNEGARAAAVDAAGNLYIAGVTTSQDLPVTRASQSAYGGHTVSLLVGDAFVAKFDPNGALVYLTYLGGSGDEFAAGLAVDAAGNAWVTGGTNSTNFPVTSATALQPRLAGIGGNGLMRIGDAFLAKIGPTGGALLYSTYFGGALDDFGSAVTLDSAGNVYVTGSTQSRDFPTKGAFQANFGGAGGEKLFPRYGVVPFDAGDVFVVKFAAANMQPVFSTYLGGSQDELSTGIAVDTAGNVFVVGHTLSTNFPTTAGAYQVVNRGSNQRENIFWNFGDGFITKLNASGSGLIYSTLLGGTSDDVISSIAIDAASNAYVAGSTCSTDFPVTTGALQNRMRGPFSAPIADQLIGDAFVAKLNAQGTALIFATYLGGTGDDSANAIGIDAAGNVYVAGFTNSSDFPVTNDAAQRTFGGGGELNRNQNYGDAFLVQLNPAATSILYGTFLGGSSDDVAMSLALDRSGNVFLAGLTVSRNFPTRSAFQPIFGGMNGNGRYRGDVFLAKISGFALPPPPAPGPVLNAVANAASFEAGTVSPGMIFTAFGATMGPDTLALGTLAANGRVSNMVSDAQLLFDGAAAPLVYVSATQSTGIVPYGVAGKTSTQVIAVYKGQRSAPLTVRVADAAPGIFAANSRGFGQGAISNQDGTPNSAGNPASIGDIVVFYGTGEGQTNPAGADGLVASTVFPKPVLTVNVTIGGQPAEVLYAGAVPLVVAGEFQVNVRVPEGIEPGDQPVVVSFGAFRSQANLTVAVQ